MTNLEITNIMVQDTLWNVKTQKTDRICGLSFVVYGCTKNFSSYFVSHVRDGLGI